MKGLLLPQSGVECEQKQWCPCPLVHTREPHRLVVGASESLRARCCADHPAHPQTLIHQLWVIKICVSNEFPGSADAAVPGAPR